MQIRCCLQLHGAEAGVACQAADCRVHCEQQKNKKPGRKLRNFLGETLGFHCQLLLFGFDQKQTGMRKTTRLSDIPAGYTTRKPFHC